VSHQRMKQPPQRFRAPWFVLLAGIAMLVVQGFQCASPELTTARRAAKEKDFAKAKVSAEALLAKEPKSVEGHMILAMAAENLNDMQTAAMAYRRIMMMDVATPQQKAEASRGAYKLWVDEYNAGVTAYNAFVTTGIAGEGAEAQRRLTAASELKPEISEPLALLGRVQLDMTDTATATITFSRWWKSEKPGFDVAATKGVVLAMPRAQLLRTVGAPIKQHVDSLTNGGLLHRDQYDVGGRDFYVFSSTSPGDVDGVVDGWTYAPPPTLSVEEQRRNRVMSLDPLKQLAIVEFNRGQFEPALEWCTVVAKAKPSDMDLAPLRTKLYQELGRTDEALAEIRALVHANPTDQSYRNTLASMLQTLGKTDEAQKEFETVLANEPNNDIALFNLGALWKNVAADKQKAERDRAAADKKYRINEKAYHDDLMKSASYYDRLQQLPKYRDDLLVLEQLYNIFEVARNEAKRNTVIAKLEALDVLYSTDLNYLALMERIYARSNMEAKARAIEARIKKLR
jgi:tetratricopeptide (TPR) repeat protein